MRRLEEQVAGGVLHHEGERMEARAATNGIGCPIRPGDRRASCGT
jgi:hypothetical protein